MLGVLYCCGMARSIEMGNPEQHLSRARGSSLLPERDPRPTPADLKKRRIARRRTKSERETTRAAEVAPIEQGDEPPKSPAVLADIFSPVEEFRTEVHREYAVAPEPSLFASLDAFERAEPLVTIATPPEQPLALDVRGKKLLDRGRQPHAKGKKAARRHIERRDAQQQNEHAKRGRVARWFLDLANHVFGR